MWTTSKCILNGARVNSRPQRSLRRRRICSGKTSVPSIPVEIHQWIEELTSRPKVISTDVLDVLRAGHLQRTLPTRQDGPTLSLKGGDELPKAHHMVYFQPETMLRDLAEDGSSPEYNAPSPFLRRMWASGSMSWNASNPLRIGSKVIQAVNVPKAEFKSGMIFVHQSRDIYNGDQETCSSIDETAWSVREVRTHVFREEVLGKNRQVLERARKNDIETSTSADLSFKFTPSPPLLFRYSALTFNPHRIHYDNHWTQEVEGHPALLMHGPLTATLLVEIAGQAATSRGKTLQNFRYRATNPLYVSQEVRLSGEWVNGVHESLVMEAVQEGRVGMTASVTMA